MGQSSLPKPLDVTHLEHVCPQGQYTNILKVTAILLCSLVLYVYVKHIHTHTHMHMYRHRRVHNGKVSSVD